MDYQVLMERTVPPVHEESLAKRVEMEYQEELACRERLVDRDQGESPESLDQRDNREEADCQENVRLRNRSRSFFIASLDNVIF
jgi:hypothetical protein